MSYRFTNTEKWEDSWFSGLKQIEMLLFMYLCDNCDIAGFAEINLKRWSSDLNSNPDTIEGALKGLQRGIIISNDGTAIYLRNFLKHQKNLPLNPNNKAHAGILKRFELYRYKFDIQNINDFIQRGLEAPSKGLGRGTGIGIGIGIGIGNIVEEENKEKGVIGGKEKEEEGEFSNVEEFENDVYLFDRFWNDYDKKVGSKDKLKKKWAKIPDHDKLKIKEHIPLYKEAQPDKKYRKNPETYLNNQSWNDEIIKNYDNRNSKNRSAIDEDYKRSIFERLQGPGSSEDMQEHKHAGSGF